MSDAPTPATTKRVYPAARPKVTPFARYEGTSVWRKNRVRARAYARYLATKSQAKPA